MFAWCVSYGGGLGVQDLGEARMHGSALGWGMLNGINSCLGVTSALLVNVSAQRPRLSTLSSGSMLTVSNSNLTSLATPSGPKTLDGAKLHQCSPARL
jgi:hypothetical protein